MKKNRGSMVIEMTLLMPVFLGCVFLYVMLFVELIHLQQKMEQAAEILYAAEVPEDLTQGNSKTGNSLAGGGGNGVAGDSLWTDEGDGGFTGALSDKAGTGRGAVRGLSCREKGDRREVHLEDPDGWFALKLQMEAGQGNPAKKLRRWQLLADML